MQDFQVELNSKNNNYYCCIEFITLCVLNMSGTVEGGVVAFHKCKVVITKDTYGMINSHFIIYCR